MARYLLRRTFVLALSLIAAGLVLFVLLRLLPGDPAAALLSVGADEAQIAAARAQVGSDQPVWVQYLTSIGNYIAGNFGTSMQSGARVADLIVTALPQTLVLASTALPMVAPASR